MNYSETNIKTFFSRQNTFFSTRKRAELTSLKAQEKGFQDCIKQIERLSLNYKEALILGFFPLKKLENPNDYLYIAKTDFEKLKKKKRGFWNE